MSAVADSEPYWLLKPALWVALVAIAALAIYETKPPRALNETAPPEQFSAARAKAHLDQIAREPHPIGSAANQRVRDYLVSQLTDLGAEVHVQTTVGITDARRQIYAGTVQNIFATMKGAGGGRALMLASHYDSAPEGPGAADAGAGVAAILETIRAVRVNRPLKNDLMVLFTDGEEEGLIGAEAFVRDHPQLVERVGLVMNFEARGSSGPALMFETSDESGWLTRQFARAAPYPLSSSLAYAVYKNLPNQTDMTVFKMAGMQGLNFAFNATFENYHTRRDTPENLDVRSLQHLGSNALALTRHFANGQLQELREPDRVYFNWFGSRLVDYPQWSVWVIFAAAAAVLLTALGIGRRRGTIAISRTLIGAAGFIAVLLAALAGAHLIWWLIGISTERLLIGDTLSNTLLVLACLVAGLAFVVAVQSWLASKLGLYNSAAGQLLAVTLPTAALTYFLPVASYVLQWPLLFASAALLAAFLINNRPLLAFFGSFPTLLIFAPLMYLLFVTLGFDVIAVSVLAVLLALVAAFMAPLLPQISRPWRASVMLLLVCSAAVLNCGLQLSQFSPEHPRRNSLFYSVNADEQRAAWISNDKAVDHWTRHFLTNAPTRGKAPRFTVGSSREVLHGDAELLPIEAPTARILADTVADGRRILKLHLASPRNANTLLMRLPAEVKIMAVTIAGRLRTIADSGESNAPWLLRYNVPPPEGVEVELHLMPATPFTCWLGDRAYGLPQIPGQTHPPRPPDMMATYGSDLVLVSRHYTF